MKNAQVCPLAGGLLARGLLLIAVGVVGCGSAADSEHPTDVHDVPLPDNKRFVGSIELHIGVSNSSGYDKEMKLFVDGVPIIEGPIEDQDDVVFHYVVCVPKGRHTITGTTQREGRQLSPLNTLLTDVDFEVETWWGVSVERGLSPAFSMYGDPAREPGSRPKDMEHVDVNPHTCPSPSPPARQLNREMSDNAR